jgi:hypothetical protein
MTIQTRIRLGRNATTEEKALILNMVNEMIALGVTDKSSTRENDDDPVNRVVVKTWTTIEAANNCIAFANTLVPPPLSAVVVEVHHKRIIKVFPVNKSTEFACHLFT